MITKYKELEKFLLSTFRENGFEEIWLEGERKKLEQYNLSDKSVKLKDMKNPYVGVKNLSISKFNIDIYFPGYKTYEKDGKFVYDYRVELNSVPISHVNVVLDLYNKTNQYPELIDDYIKLLTDIANNGYDIDYSRYIHLDSYDYNNVSNEVIVEMERLHISLGKSYLTSGNKNWAYTVKELSSVLSFIVLQEDINYPMPDYEGRRMPFYRYFESIAINDTNIQTSYSLEDVVKRTLFHGRPKLFKELDNLYLKFL